MDHLVPQAVGSRVCTNEALFQATSARFGCPELLVWQFHHAICRPENVGTGYFALPLICETGSSPCNPATARVSGMLRCLQHEASRTSSYRLQDAAVPSTRSQSHISQALMVKDWSAVAQISDPKHWSSPLAETATAWFDAAMG